MSSKAINIMNIVMNILRRIVLLAYAVTIYIVGVYNVPVRAMWDETEVRSLEYVPIWELINKKITANGFIVRYELCISRVIYQFALITIIAVALYFAFGKVSDSIKKKS